MKLITVHYLGFTAMDRRFSNPMLPWIVSEIRKRDCYERVSLGIEEGNLQAYNADFELQFSHNLQQMSRFSQADIDPCTFLYLLRDDTDQLLYCYLFQALKASDVSDLYQQMKDNQTSTPTRSLSSAASLTSLSVDISPSSSNFIEVLYIGKIKVWHQKVPDTFIDDALEKFKAHDLERRGSIDPIKPGSVLIRRRSVGSGLMNTSDSRNSHLTRSTTLSTITVKIPDVDGKPLVGEADITEEPQVTPPATPSEEKPDPGSSHESQDEICDNVSPTAMSKIKRVKFKTRSLSESNDNTSHEENKNSVAYSSDSETNGKTTSKSLIKSDDHNRTMVLQVGRTDLRLISPDRKVVLLHKQNRDIRTCAQGLVNSSHFGFICQEGTALNTYIGYVFKCESQAVASEAVGAITQSLSNTSDARLSKGVVTSCDHCPMVWYHRLCSEVEHLTDRKTQAAIFRRIDQLDEEEQSIILTKFRGAETDSLREQNEFLMMLLRAHCEMKQGRHVHDTAENRSEFLNQYLGSSTIFTKARRTLTNSFDNLLKRKASKDDLNPGLALNLAYREMSPNSQSSSFTGGDTSDRDSDGFRSRSSTVGSQSDAKEARNAARENMGKGSVSPDKTLKSPMMDIFLKVGSSPKSASDTQKPDSGSWRQAIFKRVVESNKTEDSPIVSQRNKEELRMLWKKSIHQAILLVRMEKENAKIRAQQEENAVKRIKLEYDEMKSNNRDVVEVWDLITSKESRFSMKVDNKLLLQAIHQGIPRSKRGEVWLFLAEHNCKTTAPTDTTLFPNYNVPYETLLKQLTSHQHAILIDLGRTFPSHTYFSSSLGPGQLALFNLLKAYSLLDPEVGYCQGLSFVAGVLLLHMEESQAFYLLRHLMFRRGLRKQYLPDMVALQVKLYQLSRLVHDILPELYDHFDFHEVAPTLYAAPWLLTLFASQFPLGFVTRVFDVLFLDNTDVIFKVAISLLSLHKEALLKCDNFEEIMNYLKIQLPALEKDMLEKVMKEVSTTDICKQLNEYQVEYQVLQEEMISVQPQVEALHKLEVENKNLKTKTKTITAQLELTQANILRLEKNRTLQQANINRLEMQNRTLEVTVTTLGDFINTLINEKRDIEIPDEVRRILSQIIFSEKRKTDLKNPHNNNLMSMFKNRDKVMVKSLSTGRINLNETYQENVFRSNSLNPQAAQNLQISNNNNKMASQSSHFFSNSHNQILKQKLYPYVNPGIDITIQDCNDASSIVKSSSDAATINKHHNFVEEKSVSLPLDNKLSIGFIGSKSSPTNSTDSGIATPSSPRDTVVPHPLSNCDDVQFTFNGTRELRNIKSIRNLTRNSSPDMFAK